MMSVEKSIEVRGGAYGWIEISIRPTFAIRRDFIGGISAVSDEIEYQVGERTRSHPEWQRLASFPTLAEAVDAMRSQAAMLQAGATHYDAMVEAGE